MNNVKLMWGDQELLVSEVTVDYEYDTVPSGWKEYYTGDWSSTVTVTGIMPREGVEMSYNPSKAAKYREEAQGEDYVELRKAGLLDSNGTLSESGKDLLLEILADKHKAELVKFAKKTNKEN